MICSACGPLLTSDDTHRHNISCASTGERSYCGRVIYPKPRRVLTDYHEITPGAVPHHGFSVVAISDPFFGRLR